MSRRHCRSGRSGKPQLCRGGARSVCAVGIIFVSVVFLTASAPHRVHHLFENLPTPRSPGSELRPPTVAVKGNPHQGHAGHAHRHALPAGRSHNNHDYGQPPAGPSEQEGRYNHQADLHEPAHHENAASASQLDHLSEEQEREAEPIHADVPKRDAHHDTTAQTDCLMQSAAHHSQLVPADCTGITVFEILFGGHSLQKFTSPPSFNSSPFSQRAPPASSFPPLFSNPSH